MVCVPVFLSEPSGLKVSEPLPLMLAALTPWAVRLVGSTCQFHVFDALL